MAGLIASALIGKVFDASEGEQAFQTWWDNAKHFLLYGNILLGIMALPTTMFSNSPLNCQLCSKEFNNCEFMDEMEGFHYAKTNPGYYSNFVKKSCTMKDVEEFIIYFPYLMIIIPMMMIATERGFDAICKAGLKLDSFYNHLVKECISTDQSEENKGCPTFVEKRKDIIELSTTCTRNTSFYFAYVRKTLVGLVFDLALLAYCCVRGLPILYKAAFTNNGSLGCEVYGTFYRCDGAPTKFYFGLLILSIIFLGAYGICAIYNVLWLCGLFNKLSAIMYSYRKDIRDEGGNQGLEEGLNKYYYQNNDLRLLLNLLAETSGPATSLRVLALFDEEINRIFKAKELKMMIRKSETLQTNEEGIEEGIECQKGNCVVQFLFKEAPAMNGIFKQFKKYLPIKAIMYNIEIFPPIQKLQKSKKLRVERELNPVAHQSIPKRGSVGVDAAEAGESKEHVDLMSEVEQKPEDAAEEEHVDLTSEVEQEPDDAAEEEHVDLTSKVEQEPGDAADWIPIPKKIALSDLGISSVHTIRISTIVDGKTLAFQMASFGPMKKKEVSSDNKIQKMKSDDTSEETEVEERPIVTKKPQLDFLKELKMKTTMKTEDETPVPSQDQVDMALVELAKI